MKALKHGNSSDNKNIKPVPFGRWLSYGVGASLFVHGLLVIGFIFINTKFSIFVEKINRNVLLTIREDH